MQPIEASPYDKYLDDIQSEAALPIPPSAAVARSQQQRRKVSAGALEAMMSSGLGSIAMFGDAQLRQMEQEALLEASGGNGGRQMTGGRGEIGHMYSILSEIDFRRVKCRL